MKYHLLWAFFIDILDFAANYNNVVLFLLIFAIFHSLIVVFFFSFLFVDIFFHTCIWLFIIALIEIQVQQLNYEKGAREMRCPVRSASASSA
jgi:hypothetical protein